jgi:hypothetical protein
LPRLFAFEEIIFTSARLYACEIMTPHRNLLKIVNFTSAPPIPLAAHGVEQSELSLITSLQAPPWSCQSSGITRRRTDSRVIATTGLVNLLQITETSMPQGFCGGFGVE